MYSTQITPELNAIIEKAKIYWENHSFELEPLYTDEQKREMRKNHVDTMEEEDESFIWEYYL